MKNPLKKAFTIIFALSFLIIVSGCSSDDNKRDEFLRESRERFDEIESNFDAELKNIECHNEQCDSVVYFNFNEIPEDLETIIRGNTATFSKFKMDRLGMSNITIFATHNDEIIFQCDGSKGVVKTCK